MATKSLYIGNLSYASTDATLAAAFAPFHPSNVRIINNRGYGFVDLEDDQIVRAIEGMNGTVLDGRSLVVNEANPRGGGDLSRWGDDGGTPVAHR